MIKEDNQGKAYQRGTGDSTEMKDTDSSHGN